MLHIQEAGWDNLGMCDQVSWHKLALAVIGH